MNRDGTFLTDKVNVRSVCREFFENLHSIDSYEEVIKNVCGFDGVSENIENSKSADKDEIIDKMIKKIDCD